MTVPKLLHMLVHRVARYERPFNSQDALLILKSLHLLRYRSAEVRGICEKCAFAVAASTRTTVPVERVVDVLNALLSLQAASLPIVHEKLAGRLTELTPQTASVRIAQKAAVVVMKFGRRYNKLHTTDHVFDVLMEWTTLYPDDMILRLAMIGVFAYTSTARRNDVLLVPFQEEQKEQESEKTGDVCMGKDVIRVRALLTAAEHLVHARVLSTLRGNSTLQALHLLPFLSHHGMYNGKGDAQTLITLREAFYADLPIATVVPGGYAEFLHDFLTDFGGGAGPHGIVPVLAVLLQDDFRKALNSYDVAKIATAVSHTLTKWHFQSQLQGENNNNNDNKNISSRANYNKEASLSCSFLAMVRSLVEQLEFFYTTSWVLPQSRVDQVAVGAVWRLVQKYTCLQFQHGQEDVGNNKNAEELKDIVTRLVQLTYNIKGELSAVWSWVLYSMSMCARTRVYDRALVNCMEGLVEHSFLTQCHAELPLRTCVQALYAASILMVPSIDEKELLLPTRVNINTEVQQGIQDRILQWGPKHPLVDRLLNRLQHFRYGDYTADDVPMFLQALANLAEAAVIRQEETEAYYTNMMQLVKRVLHYLQGNRNMDWYRKHGVTISDTLHSLEALLPTNTLLRDVGIDYLSRAASMEVAAMSTALCRWMEQAVRRKRRGVRCEWSREALLSLAGVQIPRACDERRRRRRGSKRGKEEKITSMYALLSATELAHELGATLSFVEFTSGTTSDANDKSSNNNNNNNNGSSTSRVVVCLDLPMLLASGTLTAVDAAHILRLMSYEIHSSGRLRAHAANISQLRGIALHNTATGEGEEARNMEVQVLLHLLRANATLQASKLLFDTASLISIMSAVCGHLHQWHQSQTPVGDASRMVHALLSSQVLLRLGRSLQSYEGLTSAVHAVLDAMEATQAEKPETIFKLRLLCGD